MTRRPTMQAFVDTWREDTFTVSVAHHPAQSYSRAVQPRAMREAREYVMRNWRVGTWQLTDVTYDDTYGDVDVATTRYHFTREATR